MEFVKADESSGAEVANGAGEGSGKTLIGPISLLYCAVCSMPPEFCEYGACFDKCLPWILENCRECLSPEVLARSVGTLSLEEGKAGAEADEESKKKPRGGGAAAPRKAAVMETKIIISRLQRQKRKFITTVAGLDTVPDLKLKDAMKVLGKKFSSGVSIHEGQGGQKDVVIQGDISLEIPQVLIAEFKVAPSAIFYLEDDSLRPYA
eukprot:gene34246-41453_t